MERNEIFKAYGTNYREMTVHLCEKSALSELIGDRKKRIGIKPNLATPCPAEFGGTTHPEVVAGILDYLREHGFENIVIAEGSWVGDSTKEAFLYCGYNTLAEKYQVPLIDTQKDSGFSCDCGGMKLKLCSCVKDIDFLINVPVLKGHCQVQMTCALKNMKGLIPDSEKRRFHTIGLHKPIAHLNCGIRQDFIVVDHICGDLSFEDGGNPVERNCILTARDPVLADAYACRVLGLKPRDVEYVKIAEKLGLGSTDLEQANIVTIEGRGVEELPKENLVMEVSYAVQAIESCSACYGRLMPVLQRLKEEGLLEHFQGKICIGQGYQGEKGEVGIGNCTRDFDFFVEGCPPLEDDIYRELKAYISAGDVLES